MPRGTTPSSFDYDVRSHCLLTAGLGHRLSECAGLCHRQPEELLTLTRTYVHIVSFLSLLLRCVCLVHSRSETNGRSISEKAFSDILQLPRY